MCIHIVPTVTHWTHIVLGGVTHWMHVVAHAMAHWPWATIFPTIAAFSAAGAALWVARNEIRERQQLLGREIVSELIDVSLNWSNQAGRFLGAVRRWLLGTGNAAEVNNEALDVLTEASNETVRALMVARMASNDFDLDVRISAMEAKIIEFVALLQRPDPPQPESPEQQRHRLTHALDAGLIQLHEFGPISDAVVQRGHQLYSVRHGVRYRRAQRRWDRQLARAQASEPDPPDSDAGASAANP
jgi:hypothetical protein